VNGSYVASNGSSAYSVGPGSTPVTKQISAASVMAMYIDGGTGRSTRAPWSVE
jgi:regulator of extracellular matrix RemA (YlzA/DUF370 family)